MITKKTLFINKKFDKFYQKNILNKIKNKLPFYPSSRYSKLIIYKYKNYTLEAPIDISKKVFSFMFGYDKDSKFLDNFEISEYEDSECLENKRNTEIDIFINKRQISFFKFIINSFETLYYLQLKFTNETKEAIIKEILKKTENKCN